MNQRRAYRLLRRRRARVAVWLWPLALLPLTAVFSGLLVGCSGGAGKVEFVVYFAPEATEAQKDAVRNACPGFGGATLEPRDRSNLATAKTYPVRYDITKASSADRGAVIKCVGAQPGVRGISESDGAT